MPTPRCDCEGVCDGNAFLHELNALFCAAVRAGHEEAFLQRALVLAMRAVGGDRAFLALVEQSTGDLVVVNTAGLGWTPETARLRLSLVHESARGITGHVVLTAEPYRAGDVTKDPHYIEYFRDVRSEIAAPISGTSGQSVGVINVESVHYERFTDEHEHRLAAISHATAAALRVQGFRARESALIEIGNNLTTTLDIQTLMQKVLAVAADVLRFEDCTVFLLDEMTDLLVLTASGGGLAERLGEAPYKVGDGITGWVAAHGEAVRLIEPRLDPRWRGLCVEFPENEIGALLAVPIVGRNRVLGVLRVVRRKSPTAWFSPAFSEGEERVLNTIGRQLGAAVENVRSYERLISAERMAAWGELSARAAHMIGNRTFALKGDLNELNYLLSQKPCEEIRAEVVDLSASMFRGVERLEEILREFRDFVVATQITLAPCDLNAVVRETLSETFPKRSSVALSLDLDEGLPELRCDARKLKRAFGELVENAVTFQPDGGALDVRTFVLSAAERADGRLGQSREYVGIEFADAGPGIVAEHKDRVFMPFYTTRAKGMGLGLSIVKGIVEAHQGVVREVGAPGEGARFVVCLPASEVASPTAAT
ncbi:MAG: GAF domain-containing protein [Armatimonadetes bacterium]|nr:GAF domain-containing protein [Armatimonadota bacterium]